MTLTSPHPSSRPGWCEPRAATERFHKRFSYEDRIGYYAHAFGFEYFYGWQHHVAGPALEVNEDNEFHYRTVVVIVGRQSGKTTGLLALRALIGLMRGEKVAFSAQNRVFGREKFIEIVECLEMAFGDDLVVSRRIGSENAVLKSGGQIRLVTPTSKGARSFTADCVLIDEAAYIPVEYLAALRPTLVTRKGAQIWLVSSAGDETSEDLARGRAAGHAALQLGPEYADTAVFEWGCVRTDTFSDRELWKRCMPTLGTAGGARMEALEDDWRNMTPLDFAREYLGLFSVDPLDTPINSDMWSPVQVAKLDAMSGIILGVDIAPDQSSSSIVACGRLPDGLLGVHMVAHGAGDAWLIYELDAAYERFSPMEIVLDEKTPSGSLVARLEASGRKFIRTTTAQMTGACAGLVTGLELKEVRVQHDEDFTSAALSATRRSVSGAWAFDRRKLRDGRPSPAISPIVAGALAVNARMKIPVTPSSFVLESVGEQSERQRLIDRIMSG